MKRNIIRLAVAAAILSMATAASAQNFGFGGNQQSQTQAQYSEKQSDINYVGDNQAYHTLDVYLPKTQMPEKGYPVIIHIYGSAWFSNSSKGMADINTICAALLDAGYAIVCPNHRSSGDAKYPAQIQDVKAVVRWVRGNAAKYHFDTSFIGTSGFSSGAHLSSLCAATNGVKTGKSGNVEMDIEGSLGEYTGESSYVNACCEWSGPIDMLAMDCDGIKKPEPSPEDALMGFSLEGNEDAYNLLSPIHYLTATTVPIFVNHGEKDNIVPHCQGELFWNALQQAGVKGARYHSQPDGGHGFNMYTKENLDAMVEFFNSARLGK